MAKARVEMIINGQHFKASGDAKEVMHKATEFVQQQFAKSLGVKQPKPKANAQPTPDGAKAVRTKNRMACTEAKAQFMELVCRAGLTLHVSVMEPSGEHWMIEGPRGRVANFWPSTMRVNLCAERRSFFVADPLDAARSAIARVPIGMVEPKKETADAN